MQGGGIILESNEESNGFTMFGNHHIGEALTDLIRVDFHECKTYTDILDLADTLETEL
jgi:hypothetical protein